MLQRRGPSADRLGQRAVATAETVREEGMAGSWHRHRWSAWKRMGMFDSREIRRCSCGDYQSRHPVSTNGAHTQAAKEAQRRLATAQRPGASTKPGKSAGEPRSLSQEDLVAALLTDFPAVGRPEPTVKQAKLLRHSGVLTQLGTQPPARRRQALQRLAPGVVKPEAWIASCKALIAANAPAKPPMAFPSVATEALSGTEGSPAEPSTGAGRLPTGDGPRTHPRIGIARSGY